MRKLPKRPSPPSHRHFNGISPFDWGLGKGAAGAGEEENRFERGRASLCTWVCDPSISSLICSGSPVAIKVVSSSVHFIQAAAASIHGSQYTHSYKKHQFGTPASGPNPQCTNPPLSITRGVPMELTLMPITWIDDRAARLKREINSDMINQAVTVFDELDQSELSGSTTRVSKHKARCSTTHIVASPFTTRVATMRCDTLCVLWALLWVLGVSPWCAVSYYGYYYGYHEY